MDLASDPAAQAAEVERALAGRGDRAVIRKIRYSHDAMIDLIIMEPSISQNELAATFGYTPGWVSQVMSTDMFKARLEVRKEELTDPTIRATLKERFEAVTRRSLEILMEKLSVPNPPDNLVLEAAKLGSKSLGMGISAPPPPAPNAVDHLANLAHRLVSLQSNARKGEIYEQLDPTQQATDVDFRPEAMAGGQGGGQGLLPAVRADQG